MALQILIAEDDPNFGMVLKSYLEVNDFIVTLCPDGKDALSALQVRDFDLCIFDVMMPNLDGFSLATRLKKENRQIPFFFLTARGFKEDQVKGYQLGAMDYLVKPFDPEILLLKINAILQNHVRQEEAIPRMFEIGSFSFDSETRQLILDGNTQKLSPKESALLQMLCIRKDEVLPREDALVKIWKEDTYFTTKSMDVYITKLRKYLKVDMQNDIQINNLHSKGFMLTVKTKS